MTDQPIEDFDGCNSECRKAGKHSLRWGGCEHATPPEPTVSMSVVYTDPTDGYPAIGFDTYTVPQLAELIEPALRTIKISLGPNARVLLECGQTVGLSAGEYASLALAAADAIVHRHDEEGPVVPVSSPPPDQTALRDRIIEALLAPRYGGPQHNTPGGLPLTATPEEARRHRAGQIADLVLGVLPPPADRAALERVREYLEARLDQVALDRAEVFNILTGATEPPLSPYYSHEACGFHWHGRDGMDIPMRDGQPVCPRCELARLEELLAHRERRCEELRVESKRRGKVKLEQAEKIQRLEKQLDEVRTQLGAEILRAGQAEAALRRLAAEVPQPDTGTLTAERPRCPDCHLPHDLTPGSMGARACEMVRADIADAERRHAEGDHSRCALVDCEVVRAARTDEPAGARQQDDTETPTAALVDELERKADGWREQAFQNSQALGAALATVDRVRQLHDRLAEETDLTSPDDPITRGAAAKRIATALDGWNPTGAPQCDVEFENGARCAKPAGHRRPGSDDPHVPAPAAAGPGRAADTRDDEEV